MRWLLAPCSKLPAEISSHCLDSHERSRYTFRRVLLARSQSDPTAMSFIAAFHSFSLTITNVEEGVYSEHRVKTPRHQTESLEDLSTRMLVYCHAYREGLTFEYQGASTPLLVARNALGEITTWVFIGSPEVRSLAAVLRERALERAAVYFTSEEEIEQLCGSLRGTTDAWVKGIRFYLTDSRLATSLARDLGTSATWTCSQIDGSLFVTADSHEYVGVIPRIDLWARFENILHHRSSQ